MFGLRVFSRFKQTQFITGARAMTSTHVLTENQSLDPNNLDVKPFEEIPGPSGIYNWPVIGPRLHFKPFTSYKAETCHKLFNSLFQTYGPIVKVKFSYAMILISDLEDLETVRRHEGRYPTHPTVTLSVIYTKRTGLKERLVDMQGLEWSKLRAQLNKRLMKVNSASHYLQPQNVVADEFVHVLANEKLDANEMADFFFRYSTESLAVVCFNTRLGPLTVKQEDAETKAIFEASQERMWALHKSILGLSIAHKWYRNKTYKDYERSQLLLRKRAETYLTDAKEKLESSRRDGTLDPEEPNLLRSLLSDPTICHEDIVNIILTLFNNGRATTATTLQTLFFNLAQNPDKQETLRKEVLSVVGIDQPLTEEAMSKMHYLKACLNETFRLIPPTPTGVNRILPTDVVLSGYKVPAGNAICIHNNKTCRDHFRDPDKFIPERWLRKPDGRRAEDFPKIASVPFGFGIRNCVGRRFAEQKIYLSTVKVLQKLKIDTEEESRDIEFNYKIFVQPERPIKFIFNKI